MQHGGMMQTASMGSGGEILLDFLYPAQTMALLTRISLYGMERWERRRAQRTFVATVRKYSSATGLALSPTDPPLDYSIGGGVQDEVATERVSPEYRVPNALDSLHKLLDSASRDSQEQAWQLYLQLDPSERIPDIVCTLLEYLSTSPQTSNAQRSLSLFQGLQQRYRRTSSYKAAIMSCVQLGKVGKAVQLHDEALQNLRSEIFWSKSRSDVGSGSLLAHAIDTQQWNFAMHIFDALARGCYNSNRPRYDHTGVDTTVKILLPFWARTTELPNLTATAFSLTTYVKTNAVAAALKLQKWRRFIIEVTAAALVQNLYADDQVMRDIFEQLGSIKITPEDVYEAAIMRSLAAQPESVYSNQSKLFTRLYRRYRCEDGFKPYKATLFAVMYRLCQHESASPGKGLTIQTVVADARQTYGHLSRRMLILLMNTFARSGDLTRVQGYFDELRSLSKKAPEDFPVKLDALKPLLYVHARRAELERAVEQFSRISQEFHLAPDTTCWNMLLHAYARADDIDGAIQCFNEALKAGIRPDKYTFGPILHLSASRGDVDTVRELLQVVSDKNVRLSVDMVDNLVWAHIRNDDLTAAEKTAQGALQDIGEGKLTGSATIMWNMLLSAHSQRKDTDSAMRLYQQMTDDNIPLDKMTYAALMQALVALGQTDAAYKILRNVIPEKQLRTLAFHYAIVMVGFTREGRHSMAMRAHDEMQSRGIKSTISTQVALLKAKAHQEKQTLRKRRIRNPEARLFNAEISLRDVLEEIDATELAAKQPSIGLAQEPLDQAYPAAYFGHLIDVYGSRGAVDAVKELMDRYLEIKRQVSGSDATAPIRMLSALMDALFYAGQYQEVEQTWELVQEQASRTVRLLEPGSFSAVSSPLNSSNETATTSPDTSETAARHTSTTSNHPEACTPAANPPKIAPARRKILSRPLSTYLRTLMARERYSEITPTVNSLLSAGYDLDNLTWNLHIQISARRGRMQDAFALCEARLMPNWPGWVPRAERIKHWRYAVGFEHMRVKRSNLLNVLMPRYRTMVILAAALKYVREHPGAASDGGVDVERLREVAPLTVRAVEALPVIYDRLQGKFLGRKRPSAEAGQRAVQIEKEVVAAATTASSATVEEGESLEPEPATQDTPQKTPSSVLKDEEGDWAFSFMEA